nr:MAG TPA: hypothetical protein [Caudoviricetes sp.]
MARGRVMVHMTNTPRHFPFSLYLDQIRNNHGSPPP